MLFADLVTVCHIVDAFSSHRERVIHVGALLRVVGPVELAANVGLLARHRAAHSFDPNPFAALPNRQATLTCVDVDDALTRIERAAPDQRASLIGRLMDRATVAEQLWITEAVDGRGLDRDSVALVVAATADTTGMSESAVLRAATLSGSLQEAVVNAFDHGETGLLTARLEPGRPIPPTVPARHEPPDRLLESPSKRLVEWDVGADRIQVHRRSGIVTVFDEQLEDVTPLAPDIVEEALTFPGGDLVLDGWAHLDRATSMVSPAVAGWTRRAGALRLGGPALFFDALFVGTSVVDEPLAVRHTLLAAVVPEHLRLPSLVILELDDLVEAMNDCARAGHDGLLLKPLDGAYEGGLTESSWGRVPRAHVVRLAIVGARFEGTGPAGMSTLHLAARDHRHRFVEVGQASLGFDAEAGVRQSIEQSDLVLAVDEDPVSGRMTLRPELTAVVAVDGIDEPEGVTEALTMRNPHVIDFGRGTADVTTVRALRDVARATRDADGTRPPNLPVLPAVGGSGIPSATLPTRLAWARTAPLAVAVETSDVAPTITPTPPTRPVPPPAALVDRIDVSEKPVSDTTTEPKGSASPWPARAVFAARLVALAWVVAILTAALDSSSASSEPDGSTIGLLGRVGIAIVAIVVVAHWYWSDQVIRSVGEPDRRRRDRLLCAAAWLSPPIAAMVITVAFVPLDIAPVIVAAVFAIGVWQPYRVLRGVLSSSMRKSADVVITSAYTVDLAAFGIIWWGLTLWSGDDVTRGENAILVGVAAAVAVSMAIALPVWLGLVAVAHTAVTGEPTAVFTPRPRRRRDRGRPHEAAELAIGVSPTDGPSIGVEDPLPASPTTGADDHDDHDEHDEDRERDDRSPAAVPLAERESTTSTEPTDPAPGAVEPAGTTSPASSEVDDRAAAGATAHRRYEHVDPRPEAPDAAENGALPATTDSDGDLPDGTRPDSEPDPGVPSDDSHADEQSVAESEPSPASAPASTEPATSASVGTDPGESVHDQPDADRPTGELDPSDPIYALRQRAVGRVTEGARADDAQRADVDRVTPPAGPADVDRVGPVGSTAPHDPPDRRFTVVTAVRIITVITFAALTLAAGSIVSLSIGSDGRTESGDLPASTVSDLEFARQVFWALFTISSTLVTLWSVAIVRQARAAGVTELQWLRVRILAAVAATACVAALVFDAGDRGLPTLLLSVPIVWSAVAAGFCVEPARSWFDLPPATLTAWIATLPAILGVAWLAGLSQPIDASISLQLLAFTSILLALGCARVTVMSALSSSDIEATLHAATRPDRPTEAIRA